MTSSSMCCTKNVEITHENENLISNRQESQEMKRQSGEEQ